MWLLPGKVWSKDRPKVVTKVTVTGYKLARFRTLEASDSHLNDASDFFFSIQRQALETR